MVEIKMGRMASTTGASIWTACYIGLTEMWKPHDNMCSIIFSFLGYVVIAVSRWTGSGTVYLWMIVSHCGNNIQGRRWWESNPQPPTCIIIENLSKILEVKHWWLNAGSYKYTPKIWSALWHWKMRFAANAVYHQIIKNRENLPSTFWSSKRRKTKSSFLRIGKFQWEHSMMSNKLHCCILV